MDNIPSRTELRSWIEQVSRKRITRKDVEARLTAVREKHGDLVEQDCRFILNYERELLRNEHERHRANIAADIEAQKKLYGAKK